MVWCVFDTRNHGCVCENCGRPAPCDDCQRCSRKCSQSKNGLKFGDATEMMLKSIGVTEDRWKLVKKRFGLAPKCNCRRRKEWMNKIHDYLKTL